MQVVQTKCAGGVLWMQQASWQAKHYGHSSSEKLLTGHNQHREAAAGPQQHKVVAGPTNDTIVGLQSRWAQNTKARKAGSQCDTSGS